MNDLVKRRLILLVLAGAGGFIVGSIGWGIFASNVVDAAGGASGFGPSPKAGLALGGLAMLSVLVDWVNEV